MNKKLYFPEVKDVMTTVHTLNKILVPTSLVKNHHLPDCLEANIF